MIIIPSGIYEHSIFRSGGVYGPLFAGNPAEVCVLEKEWLPDAVLQAIAAENNLPETAFIIEREPHFDLHWMTPTVEVDLCGHATLASAHVIFRHLGRTEDSVCFQSRSGELRVDRTGDRLVLDFPSQPASECAIPDELVKGLGVAPSALRKGWDYLAVFANEKDVAAIKPNMEIVARLDAQGVIVTAPGNDCDFVSRSFAPQAGIPEDPVTGSTHCALIPYWSMRLEKHELRARQISKRAGELFCEDRGERVAIGGHAVTTISLECSVP